MKMKAPEGMTGVSYDGVEYQVEDGHVIVPAEAAQHLMSHGLEAVAGDKNEDIQIEQANTVRKATRAGKGAAE